MKLTPEQINKILEAHCKRKVQAMDINELRSYALNGLKEEFDKNRGFDDKDVILLIEDIIEHDHCYGDDIIDSREFLISCGIDKKEAEELINDNVKSDVENNTADNVVTVPLISGNDFLSFLQ